MSLLYSFSLTLLLFILNGFTVAIQIRQGADNVASSAVAAAFQEAGIVPELISVPPEKLLTVEFQSGSTANLGNLLTPSQVAGRPNVSWDSYPGAFYMIIEFDFDVPSVSNRSFSPLLHWLEVNVPANDSRAGDIGQAYINPDPFVATGDKRYVQLVFRQRGRIDPLADPLIRVTNGFSLNYPLQTQIERYGLGNPVAGNFHRTASAPEGATPLSTTIGSSTSY